MQNGERYIGLVKWFRDQTKNANYSFINHENLGDLFFHKRNVNSEGITSIQIGFNVPNLAEYKDLQIISEPINIKKHKNTLLICKTCVNELNLSKDPEKSRAIKEYHIVKFV